MGCSMLCDALEPQVSSRMEIGLLKIKGDEEGDGAGALMLPEVFVQKVRAKKIERLDRRKMHLACTDDDHNSDELIQNLPCNPTNAVPHALSLPPSPNFPQRTMRSSMAAVRSSCMWVGRVSMKSFLGGQHEPRSYFRTSCTDMHTHNDEICGLKHHAA